MHNRQTNNQELKQLTKQAKKILKTVFGYSSFKENQEQVLSAILSEWGHDFRPDYLFLFHIRKNFSGVPIAAFTATATKKVQEDIVRILKMKNPFIVRASFDRKELYYQVRRKTEVLSAMTRLNEVPPLHHFFG